MFPDWFMEGGIQKSDCGTRSHLEGPNSRSRVPTTIAYPQGTFKSYLKDDVKDLCMTLEISVEITADPK